MSKFKRGDKVRYLAQTGVVDSYATLEGHDPEVWVKMDGIESGNKYRVFREDVLELVEAGKPKVRVTMTAEDSISVEIEATEEEIAAFTRLIQAFDDARRENNNEHAYAPEIYMARVDGD